MSRSAGWSGGMVCLPWDIPALPSRIVDGPEQARQRGCTSFAHRQGQGSYGEDPARLSRPEANSVPLGSSLGRRLGRLDHSETAAGRRSCQARVVRHEPPQVRTELLRAREVNGVKRSKLGRQQ
jgi:hypothetical protein